MKSSEPLIRSMGFDQFQEYRQEMLARYDSEKKKTANDPVQVWHGEVAEAEIRRWLRAFLPEKFGVTKGYVVFPKVGKFYKLTEYDVIIYDKNEAPVSGIDRPLASPQTIQSRAYPYST